ncbi:hypothetical protein FRB95_001032 [Tulasnella sp. JGI-2019a]|nr:hypothetical protein FRB95_001032 [Tulasnella sp. JGI-2019a]
MITTRPFSRSQFHFTSGRSRLLSTKQRYYKMGKKKSAAIPEEALILPGYTPPPGTTVPAPPIVDTHTHLISTFSQYRAKYPGGKYLTIHDFVRAFYPQKGGETSSVAITPNVATLVDVYCEAPVLKEWKEVADSALTLDQRAELWGGVEYHFVIGVHPHNAKEYNDEVEQDLLEAAAHPRCVGMGEMGLDYHYDNSPRSVQREVLIRQLKCAVMLGKPLTIHTREADEDILPILKEHVPRDHHIHIHCFTDTPELASSLLEHFPNLFIGITGVITYATNINTTKVIQNMVANRMSKGVTLESKPPSLRILLETDAPYMNPSNLPLQSFGMKPGTRLPFCHSGMIPWTAQYIAEAATEASEGKMMWSTYDILQIGADNARQMYNL